ncbi:MAG: toprim domain-containing protein, partial [Sphingomonadaceae bacterium]
AIRFLMEAEGQDFMGAVRQLAALAGLEVPEPAPRDREAHARRATLHGLVAAAAAWFAAELASARGAQARAYLARRGVGPDLAARFGLGWAPAAGLAEALMRRFPDATEAQLAEAGLIGEGRRQRFRERLIFPIQDPRGRPVGFGGRLLGPGEPKYLNSADGPLFHKGRLLFNLARAAPAARKSGRLLVVEGYMDVIGLARAGIDEAVAPLGTAITEDQLRLAWRLVAEPVLAFDGDAAGLKAATRAAERALPLIGPGRSLRIALLAAGEDPDDLARRAGRAGVDALADQALSMEQFLFERVAAEAPLDTPERRAGFRRRLADLAATIIEPDLRRDYAASWRARADALLARPARAHQGRWQPRGPVLAETRAAREAETGLAMALAALSARPDRVAYHEEALAGLAPRQAALARARDALLAGDPVSLPDVPPLVDPNSEGFDSAIAAALASAAALSHLTEACETGGASDGNFSDDESVREAYARASARRGARDEVLKRLKEQALGPPGPGG